MPGREVYSLMRDGRLGEALGEAFKVFLYGCFVVMLSGCGGGESDSVRFHSCGLGSSILIDKLVLDSSGGDEPDSTKVQVELKNTSVCDINLSQFSLGFGRIKKFVINEAKIDSNGRAVISWSQDNIPGNCVSCRDLYLADGAGEIVDELSIPLVSSGKQAFSRVADDLRLFFSIDPGGVVFGESYSRNSNVVRLAETGGFSPQDSSPNAIVKFKGFYWILSGWGNHGPDVWYSTSRTWKSLNGVNWALVNESPPYYPYSSFVEFNGKLFALGVNSFSTFDGLNWGRESISLPHGSRSVTFNNAIYSVTKNSVMMTSDGASWIKLTDSAPWGELRVDPVFLSHDGFLWLIGGNDQSQNGLFISYKIDVWRSRDGIVWDLVTESAAWGPRRWMNGISSAGLLWVMNGANHEIWPDEYGNVADIWNSRDGKNWVKIQSPVLWTARHAAYITGFDDSGFIILGGYGHNGVNRMYGDVWYVESRRYR